MMVLWADNREPDGQVIDLRPHFGAFEPEPTIGEQLAAGPSFNDGCRMLRRKFRARRRRRLLKYWRRRLTHYARLVPAAALILILGWLVLAGLAVVTHWR